jgi:hypothetical protein
MVLTANRVLGRYGSRSCCRALPAFVFLRSRTSAQVMKPEIVASWLKR